MNRQTEQGQAETCRRKVMDAITELDSHAFTLVERRLVSLMWWACYALSFASFPDTHVMTAIQNRVNEINQATKEK